MATTEAVFPVTQHNLNESSDEKYKDDVVAVRTKKGALKVLAGEIPHLVSLGGDRFSTAVTLHQITEGRVSLGFGKHVDIPVFGTGVEEVHCWIENTNGVVILHPNSDHISIDGLKVSQPTRLTQGCMLCLGRSNFFRFNHPQEAKYMKSVLPNTRVSIMQNVFYPANYEEMPENKISPSFRHSYDSPDSWCDGSSEASSEDVLSCRNGSLHISKHISPKVFPPGSSTLNSPASVVLGHKYSNQLSLASLTSSSSNSLKTEQEEKCGDRNNNFIRDVVNDNCSVQKQRLITPPSPAFDRNPTYPNAKSPVVIMNGKVSPCNGFLTSSPTNSDKTCCNGFNWSPTTTSPNSVLQVTDADPKKLDVDAKRKQVHNNRVIEQEKERLERLRLEEILTLCAEYEKQSQFDRSKSQIRIKTNGSLPREKKNHSGTSSPALSSRTPDSSICNQSVFTFDKKCISINNEVQEAVNRDYPGSPRCRIKTVASPNDHPNASKENTLEIMENKLAVVNDHEILNVSQNSKRMNIRDRRALPKSPVFGSERSSSLPNSDLEKCRVNSNVHEKIKIYDPNFNGRLDPKGSSKLGVARNNRKLSLESNSSAFTSSLSKSYHTSYEKTAVDTSDMFVSMFEFGNRKEEHISHYYNSNVKSSTLNGYHKNSKFSELNLKTRSSSNTDINFKCSEVEELNGLVLELNQIVKETERTLSTRNGSQTEKSESKFILPLDEPKFMCIQNDSKYILPLEQISTVIKRQCFSSKKSELKKLQTEQSALLSSVNDIKNKLSEIQQQKDEIMKDLEMEKILVEAELRSENEKLRKEEDLKTCCQNKIQEIESMIEICSRKQLKREAGKAETVNKQKDIICSLEDRLDVTKNETERVNLQKQLELEKEILEEEMKQYEDSEFRLLEEEASLLSKREELQNEFAKIGNNADEIRLKISELYSQKEMLLQNASDEIKMLELQVRNYTATLQKNHSRLQEIGIRLKETSRSLSEISDCASDSFEDIESFCKTQSQEDLDRISRVTSDAPLVESGSTSSLGRRTIASLQEIERNRQLHLAEQGGQVIEEERKRVEALKKKVQDQVKAQWEEEKKQREHHNSFDSDTSSLISIDRLTESPGNKDNRDVPNNNSTEDSAVLSSNEYNMSQSRREDEEEKPVKVRSQDDSSVTQRTETTSVVKVRRNKSSGSVLRPESRHPLHRDQSFDLRRHLESAGHLLERCPHVIVDKVSCKGYLQKMTTKFRGWNKRWFVFDRVRCSFSYYNDKNEKKVKAVTSFQNLVDLYIDKTNLVKSPNPQATFIVKTKERTYYLLAPSIETMRIWFDVLATEIDVYQDG